MAKPLHARAVGTSAVDLDFHAAFVFENIKVRANTQTGYVRPLVLKFRACGSQPNMDSSVLSKNLPGSTMSGHESGETWKTSLDL